MKRFITTLIATGIAMTVITGTVTPASADSLTPTETSRCNEKFFSANVEDLNSYVFAKDTPESRSNIWKLSTEYDQGSPYPSATMSLSDMTQWYPCQILDKQYKKVKEEWQYYTRMAYASYQASVTAYSYDSYAYMYYQEQAKSYLTQELLWAVMPLYKEASPSYQANLISLVDNLANRTQITDQDILELSSIILWHVTYLAVINKNTDALVKYNDVIARKGAKHVSKAIGKGPGWLVKSYVKQISKMEPLYKKVAANTVAVPFFDTVNRWELGQ
jgi:hypothetical protein